MSMESLLEHPHVSFAHLEHLTGDHGMWEHARRATPRRSHGYTTDDNARAVVLLCRLPEGHEARRLMPAYLEMVLGGRIPGAWRNRMSQDGRWHRGRGSDDCHGRALWALGVAADRGPRADRDRTRVAFTMGADLESPWPRANAYACLGAAGAVSDAVAGPVAERLLERLLVKLPSPRAGAWVWPEDRLTYANARIPEAYLALGAALDDDEATEVGLHLLEWLVGIEWSGDRFSFTPVAGRGPGEKGPAFDQQPIEAWAMLDACGRALGATGDDLWATRKKAATEWFFGRNDVGVPLYIPETGGGYDGLTSTGVNENQGAESTLAALAATIEHAGMHG